MALKIATLLAALALSVAPMQAHAQATAATEPHIETAAELSARFTPAQRQQFDAARKAHLATHYQDALTGFKSLLQQLPDDALLTKFASDSALEAGDSAYALGLLKPLVQTNVEDWQAVVMLARAAAESGDTQTRNAAMINLAILQQHGLTLPQYTLERLKVGPNTMTILCALIPSGPYKPYYIARVADPKGQIFMRITLESSDGDQLMFARQHPKEAAAGAREFTLDAYRETGLNQDGQRTQAHFTYKFFIGQPTYDTVREEFINVVNGKTSPISSRTGLIVP
jgi:hypothetical protein